jgi:choline dehydrogenase-like flavoprotein
MTDPHPTPAATFDAIIVGSGASGGMAARELTRKGLRVLVLERGRHVEHGTDYVGEDKNPWEFQYRGLNDRQHVKARQPIQGTSASFEEGSSQFWVDDVDYPYDQSPEAPFSWIRGHHTGGRSITWGRATPRLSALNFEEPGQDGHGVDWPIRYGDIAPWYSYAERYIGVSGEMAGNPNVPDGEFLPPMPLNCVEQHVRDTLHARFPGRTLMPERSSVLSADHNGRPACHYCGPCYRGCSTASYYSSIGVSLPEAQATGLMTLMDNAIVAGVDHDPATRRVTGVRVIDAVTRERRFYAAKLIFLNASTVGTAQILLLSRSEAFPTGLANRSGQVGRNLMDHVYGAAVTARFSGFEQERPIGNRPINVYVPRFRNVDGDKAPFLRGYGYQGRAWRDIWNRGEETPLVGAALKAELRKPGPWYMRLGGFGDCLPTPDNRVTLHPTKIDQWGLPQVSIAFIRGPNDLAIARDAAIQAAAMLKAAGGEIIYYKDTPGPGGLAIHEQGTARMGRDPATSVLNAYNQAHDIPNLFVTDGSCMASTGAANPTLTYLALTARACDFAVKQLAQHSI